LQERWLPAAALDLADRGFAVAAQGGQVLCDRLPDRILDDLGIAVAQPVADAANVGPRLIGSQFLCKQSELGGCLADARQAALRRVVGLGVGEKPVLLMPSV
jgi:hypothetical protein